MEKEINTEWVNTVLNSESKKEYSGDLPTIDWLRSGKDYKRQLIFKVLPFTVMFIPTTDSFISSLAVIYVFSEPV